MNLESIFDENMINLRQKIELMSSKYPSLIKAFSLRKNDPHIEKMISSFALISASLEYEIAKKMAKEIRSIFMNVFPEDFSPIPPVGLISIKPDYGKHFTVQKGKMVFDDRQLFSVKRDTYINDLRVEKIDKTFINNQLGIKVLFSGNNLDKIETIDLYTNNQTMNKIFQSEKSVEGVLINRNEYSTNCKITMCSDYSLRDFCLYADQFCFMRVTNLKIQPGIDNKIELFIPLKSNTNTQNIVIKTNMVVVENKFKTQTAPFEINGFEPKTIKTDNSLEIIKINKIITLENEEINHITKDPKGWHLLINKDNLDIYVSKENLHTNVFAEIECCNKYITINIPYFEEYIPGASKWESNPTKIYKYVYQNEVSKLIQMMYIDKNSIDHVFETISGLLLIYNSVLKIEFSNVSIMESIKPIKLSNYVLPKMYSTVSCSTNTNNFFLLRHIVEEIRIRLNTNVDFIFNTPDGDMYYE